MTQEKLNVILANHRKWLKDEDDGQRANLQDANLQRADLQDAELQDADLDYSCFALWCGSLKANFCDRFVVQLLYHILSIVQNSRNVSGELKKALLIQSNINIANKFHRIDECGKIKIYEEENY